MKERIKILTVVGARPNFIKIAPLLKEFKKHKNIQSFLVHTGQHYDFEMSKIFFKELDISKPDCNLGVGSGYHAWQTAKMMEKLEPILLKEKPNLVIVVGDVNSTLAGALAAAKLHFPLAHIEAGVRSFDKKMPEEINRVLTDHISDFLFCPTKTATSNLKKEGIRKGIYNVGDIMYDTFLKNIKTAQKKSKILKKFKLKPKNYLLLTLHRPQNVDNPEHLKKIIRGVGESGQKIIFPVHPRTKNSLRQFSDLRVERYNNILFIRPLSYLEILTLEKNSKKILTDSGGIQKEAYWLKVPCITLRKMTEWVETIKDGWNFLVGVDEKKILKAIWHSNSPGRQFNHFGRGKTAQKIMKILLTNIK